MSGPNEFQRRLESIERLLHKIESAADPGLRTAARDVVQLVMDLHGAGLERVLEIVNGGEGSNQEILEGLSQDNLVSSLLVLHGIHPLSLETRVKQALEQIRGGEAELLGIDEGIVRVRLEASLSSAGRTFKSAVEEAIYNAAPDITDLIVEGGDQPGFVPLEMLRCAQTRA